MTGIEVAQGVSAVDEIHRIDRGRGCIEEKLARGGTLVRTVAT